MNDKLERIWKEAAVIFSNCYSYSGSHLQELGKTTTTHTGDGRKRVVSSGNNAMQFVESRPTFQRNISPPSSGSKKPASSSKALLEDAGDILPEKSLDFRRTTWLYIPENRALHNHRCKTLKSCKTSGVRVEIRTEYLSNNSLERDRYAIPFHSARSLIKCHWQPRLRGARILYGFISLCGCPYHKLESHLMLLWSARCSFLSRRLYQGCNYQILARRSVWDTLSSGSSRQCPEQRTETVGQYGNVYSVISKL